MASVEAVICLVALVLPAAIFLFPHWDLFLAPSLAPMERGGFESSSVLLQRADGKSNVVKPSCVPLSMVLSNDLISILSLGPLHWMECILNTPDFPVWPINSTRIPISPIKLVSISPILGNTAKSLIPRKEDFFTPLLFSAWLAWCYAVLPWKASALCLCHPHLVASSTRSNFPIISLLLPSDVKYEKITWYCVSWSTPVVFMLWKVILELYDI